VTNGGFTRRLTGPHRFSNNLVNSSVGLKGGIVTRKTVSSQGIATDIGAKVRRRRLMSPRVKTQSALAGSAGISISFLSMIERGERLPTIETLYRIATALGVHPAQLLT
jgi:DNA-binding XRE family transcriptional regulator